MNAKAEVFASVRARAPLPCVTDRLRDSGCTVPLGGLPAERLLIKLDGCTEWVPRSESKCDFLYVDDRMKVAAIELKNRRVEASEVHQQLQAGARIAESRLLPHDTDVEFYALAFGKGVKRRQRRALSRSGQNVRFRGKRYEIIVGRCQQPLREKIG